MIIQSKNIYLSSSFKEAQIEIKDKTITAVYPYGFKEADVDYGELRIVPGFIDIHTHGYGGYDLMSAEKEGLRQWMKDLPKEGVTSFCPTTLSDRHERIAAALSNISEVMKEENEGAAILGAHMEGPYVDEAFRGVQTKEVLLSPSVEEFEEYRKAADDNIRIITVAVEHDRDLSFTRYCANNGIIVSIGHSGATYEQAMLALANGAESFTHTYNAMSSFKHRENGVVGAAFCARDTYSEVIPDGNHSTAAALNIFFKEKDRHAISVSDSLSCKGKAIGEVFDFCGKKAVIYPDGSAHLKEEGTLAGSTLRLNEGLRLLVEKALVPFDIALNSLTFAPADLLKMGTRKGKIKVGYDADITILREDYSVEQTYVLGKKQLDRS